MDTETTTTTYRERLGRGADTGAGARELALRIDQARHERDGLNARIRRMNAELHRATEAERWTRGGRAREGARD